MNKVLILGDGGIGSALKNELYKRSPSIQVLCTSRNDLDPLDETSWAHFKEKYSQNLQDLDLVISTYGLLNKPEKRLEDMQLERMIDSFSINAFTAPLVAKHLHDYFSKESSSLVFLSAKVGSIDDNKMGGWYSYRAAKAALNQFMKTISNEFIHRRIKTKVLSIHPGTTNTKLSSPYLGGTSLKVWDPEETANHILDVIETNKETGVFLNWDGKSLPW